MVGRCDGRVNPKEMVALYGIPILKEIWGFMRLFFTVDTTGIVKHSLGVHEHLQDMFQRSSSQLDPHGLQLLLFLCAHGSHTVRQVHLNLHL